MNENSILHKVDDEFYKNKLTTSLNDKMILNSVGFIITQMSRVDAISELRGHQESSRLEYFSKEQVSLLIESLSNASDRKVSIITGGSEEVIFKAYFTEEMSFFLGGLIFRPYIKSLEELNCEKLLLGISDKK